MSLESLRWHCVLASLWISAGLLSVPLLCVYYLTTTTLSGIRLVITKKNIASRTRRGAFVGKTSGDGRQRCRNASDSLGPGGETSAYRRLKASLGHAHAGSSSTPLRTQLASYAPDSSLASNYSIDSTLFPAVAPISPGTDDSNVLTPLTEDNEESPLTHLVASETWSTEAEYLYTMGDIVPFGEMTIISTSCEQSHGLRRRGAIRVKRLVRERSKDAAGSDSSDSSEGTSTRTRKRVTFAAEISSVLGSDASSSTAASRFFGTSGGLISLGRHRSSSGTKEKPSMARACRSVMKNLGKLVRGPEPEFGTLEKGWSSPPAPATPVPFWQRLISDRIKHSS